VEIMVINPLLVKGNFEKIDGVAVLDKPGVAA
jgi:hypothetical protein